MKTALLLTAIIGSVLFLPGCISIHHDCSQYEWLTNPNCK